MAENPRRPTLRELLPGRIVQLPTGHRAVVKAVDLERGCVDVESLPWRACFRPLHLRVEDEAPPAAIANPPITPSEPRGTDE